MSYKECTLTIEDGVAVVTINRPKAMNALNNGVFEDLIQIFNHDINVAETKGVIITGAGDRAFAAGADIKEFLALDRQSAQALSERGHQIFSFIENYEIPVIAAVNGFSLGGGCELAMACHMRVAHAKAKFGQPEVNLGIITGYGGSQRLAQLIGKGRAMELLLTTDMINGQQAYDYGMVNRLCEAGEEVATAKEIILKIATKSPLAVAETIKTLNALYDETQDGYAAEADAFGRMAETVDFKEGVNAFIEKRPANWTRK